MPMGRCHNHLALGRAPIGSGVCSVSERWRSERCAQSGTRRTAAAKEVLHVGEVETPQPGPGEVRIRLKTSGVNPSDVKTRAGTARKIAFPRVIPHSDGAGNIDAVGAGVAQSRIGERVWTWNGQWKRPFGTAAEYIMLPEIQAVKLPDAMASRPAPASAFRR